MLNSDFMLGEISIMMGYPHTVQIKENFKCEHWVTKFFFSHFRVFLKVLTGTLVNRFVRVSTH